MKVMFRDERSMIIYSERLDVSGIALSEWDINKSHLSTVEDQLSSKSEMEPEVIYAEKCVDVFYMMILKIKKWNIETSCIIIMFSVLSSLISTPFCADFLQPQDFRW